jgi:hypothetical protein
MSVFDTFNSFEFDKNKDRIFGIKSGIIWGNVKDTYLTQPILYISKLKSITEDEFQELLNSINISFKIK